MSLTRLSLTLLLVLGMTNPLWSQALTFGHRTYPGRSTYTHADLNNDGREDLIYYTNTGFAVALSNGDGTYAAPVSYTVPDGHSAGIVTFDHNNDGYTDIFAFNASSQQFYEYLNNKNGTFHLQASYVVGTIWYMVAGDFNHDGYIDLAYSTSGTSGTQLHVYFNNHASGFSPGPVTTIPLIAQMTVGDFDGDGKADIFISAADFASPPTYILFGDNAGHFPSIVNASTGHHAIYLPMDIDGDGRTDLVGAASSFNSTTHTNTYYKSLFVLYGNSSRSVTESAIPLNGYPIPTTARTAATDPDVDQADFNGDGKADLVFVEATQANGGGNRNLVVMTGRGGRAFNPETTIYTDNSGQLDFSAEAIRANSDNKPDILVDTFANNTPTAQFFLNDTSASFGGCSLPSTATGIHLCSPTTYSSTTTKFSLSAAGAPFMHRMELWVDGVKKYQQFARDFSHYAFLDTTITLTTGTHKVSIYAAGEDNSLQRKDYTITVQ
jgi:FG-GAP-like repeat